MNVRTIQVGETGVDFAYSKPPPARLVELGYSFVVGYVSSNQSKNLLNPHDYINAGLGVIYVFELSATRPNGGAVAGTADGAFAKAWLQGCGYPTDVPVIAAFDTNSTAANLAAHVAYFNAFAVSAAPYPIGAYLDADLAARVDEAIGWLPLAWSWSGSSKADAEQKARALGYHVLQGKGFYIDNQWAVDPNVAIRPFPTWGNSKEEDMKPVFLNHGGGIYLWVPGHAPVPFASVTDFQTIAAALGQPTSSAITVSDEMFDRLAAAGTTTVTVPPIVVPPIPAAKVAITVSQVP